MTFVGRIVNRSLVGILLIVLGVGITFAAIPLFSNHFPAISANVPVLQVACSSATLVSVPAAVPPGSTGGVYFGCGSGTPPAVTGPAFTVAADGAAIPTFTLPLPYTSVSLANLGLSAVPNAGCTTASTAVLTSGTAFSFTGTNGKGNSYYYCLIYTAVPQTGLPAFDIAWTE